MSDEAEIILFPKPKRPVDTAKKKAAMEYRQVVRPNYLMDVARKQGRLHRSRDAIPGELPFEKLKELLPGEWPLCEIGLAETGCNGRRVARSVHHRGGREGERMTDEELFVCCCNECHSHVESHRAWAYRVGWLVRRN